MAEIAEDESNPARHDPYGPLRLPSYRRFLVGNLLASAGAEMQLLAVGWELYDRTKSPLDLGLVGLVMVIPVIFLALPAGHAADRFPRKLLILVAQALMALASLGLTVLSASRGPVAWFYVALFVAGVAHAISMPARWSILRQLVPDHLLSNAITWNSSGWQVASVAGPALGGLIIAQSGHPSWVYGLDLVLSFVVLALIAGIKPTAAVRLDQPATWQTLLAGIRFVGSNRLILATITLDLFAVLLGGAVALLPIFARDILHVGAQGYGWLRAAPSIGAAVMALTLAHRPPLRSAGPALLVAVVGFGMATIAFGLSRNPWLSFGLLFLTGAFDNISVVIRSTLIQFLTPEAMRGRVAAVNSIFIGCSNELGGFESGLTARYFGPVASVVGGGIGTIVTVGLVALQWPEVARLRRLNDLEKTPATTAQADPALI